MTFPALVPSTRVFSPGVVPAAIQLSLTGARSAFRRGNRRANQTLQLTFTNLTESEVNQIKTHFFDRNGTFDLFFLPAESWNGYTTPPVPIIDNVAWRYSGPIVVSDGIVGRWGVEVALQTQAINTGDLIFDGEAAAASPARTYVLDAGTAAATPARDYVIQAFAAIQ